MVPPLVMNLNLFFDEKGVLRSRGRISKCLYFNFDVHNPVLLPREHRFTSLLINYCHLRDPYVVFKEFKTNNLNLMKLCSNILKIPTYVCRRNGELI